MKSQIRDFAYSGPMLAVAFFAGPAGSVILQPLYAKYFGVSLAAIATVLVIGRIVDAVTDPLIGYVSDRFTKRYGNPAHLLFAGAILLGVCGYFLFNPVGYNPSEGDVSVGVLYFGFWYVFYYVAQTMIESPHASWGGALASSSKHKTRIYTYRSVFSAAGVLGFFFIPYLYGGESREIRPETLSTATIFYFALAPLSFYFFYHCLCKNNSIIINTEKEKKLGLSFIGIYRTVLKNKPYRVLTAAHMCTGFASSMYAAMLFFFVDSYLGLGERFALLFIITFCIGSSTLPAWYAVAARLGRRFAWVVSLAFVAIGFAGAATLKPGDDAWIPLLVFSTFIKLGFAPFMPFLSAFVSDVSDYGSLKYKTDAASTYFAAFGFINKVLVALAVSFTYAIVGWFGFDPTASSQSHNAVIGIQITFIWIPTSFLVLAVIFVANIPIDERRHKMIKRRLEQRSERLSRS